LNYTGKFAATHTLGGLGELSNAHVDAYSIQGHGHVPPGALVVPDPDLLFNGEFRRAGIDLVISRAGNEFVLHDYFKGDKRAAIASPDGAHLTGDLVSALTGYVQYSQAAPGAAAGQVIGHVTKLVGSATATRNGVSIILNNGENVEKGDVVQCGSDSTLGITFIDGTVFGLSANARMVLNEMVYDPNGSNNSSLLSLVAGTITFVAGETAKHGDMKIDTPVATMGIRGTAVLTEIHFIVPQGGGDPQPEANFQVLVEPDGTTGSYILFDKTTLLPIATVNQAGQQIHISGGNVTVSAALLSPEVQKLISDVFSLKFTDNSSNTKNATNYTDSITPENNGLFIKTAGGATAIPTFVNLVNVTDGPPVSQGSLPAPISRVPGPPNAVVVDASGNPTTAFTIGELANTTHSTDLDTVGGRVNFLDFNLADRPTVQVNFKSFTYQNASHQDVTATLSLLQLADVAATEVKVVVAPDPDNTNRGTASWTYSIPDHAFDFLAAGEVLMLTYVVRVDNNFLPSNETAFIPITVTITGTNDRPVIATSVSTIEFSGGTSVPGGPLTGEEPTSGTLTFSDVDLTDTHTVSVKLTDAELPGGSLPPGPLAIFEKALSASIKTDSTGTGTGTVAWKLADLPVYLADFIPKDKTLTLTYTVTVTDSQGAASAQTITVTITGTDHEAVVWIATTRPDSPPGGFWQDAGNWETGTVPTLSDDTIIITDQLHGLTPSFPLTIDAPAFAKSVTMNDFGSTPPVLVNLSSLTIAGDLDLSADSILRNSGMISVGGKAEILDRSVLRNSGTVTLAVGGDFKDQSSITNEVSGTIEVSGGTLGVFVDIDNSGLVKLYSGATLMLSSAGIDGGTVAVAGTLDLQGTSFLGDGTLDNSGTVEVNGDAALHDEDVTNTGTIEISDGGGLTLDLSTSVDNAGGHIIVDGGGTLTLNDATVTGGTVTDNGAIHVIGNGAISGAAVEGGVLTVDSGRTLTLNGTTVSGATIADNGTVKVDSGEKLTLNDVNLSGGVLAIYGTLESTGATTVTDASINNSFLIEAIGGVLALVSSSAAGIANQGTIRANGGELDIANAVVTNTGTLAAIDDSMLKLTSVTVTNGGTVSTEWGSTLEFRDSTINGGTLAISGTLEASGTSAINKTDIEVDVHGAIDVTGTLTIDPPASYSITNLGLIEANGGELDVTGESIANGGTLAAINHGTLKLTSLTVTNTGTLSIQSGSTLGLLSANIYGGTLNNAGYLHSVSGANTVSAAVANAGTIEVTAGTLDLAGGLSGGGALIIDDGATLELAGATAQTVTFAGGINTLQLDDVSGLSFTGTIAGVSSKGGTFTVTGAGNIASTSGDALDFTASGGTVANPANISLELGGALNGATNGIVVVQNGVGDISLAVTGDVTGRGGAGIVVAQDGSNAIGSTHVTNSGTVLAAPGFAAIVVHENAAGAALIDNFGNIGSSAVSALSYAIVETGGDLTIDNAGDIYGNLSLANATFNNEAAGTWTVAGDSVFGVLSLTGIKISTIDNAGAIHLIGSASIHGVNGLSIGNSGEIDSLWGWTSITGDIINTGTVDVSGGTLTIGAAGSLVNSGTLEADGGTLIINSSLSGTATILGTSMIELGAGVADAYASATITFGAASTGVLKLDHSETFAGKVAGFDDGKLDLADIAYGAHTTVSYSGDANGGVLTIVNNDDPTQTAHIELAGNYLGSGFHLGSDGSGGTYVTEAPGAIAGLDSSGNAVEGTPVTAIITDGGRMVTNATYQWQLNGVDIPHATDASYTPTENDERHLLSVKLTFTDATGQIETTTVSAGTVQEGPHDTGPVIVTDHFLVWHNWLTNTDTITGLQIVDPASGASGETFTLTASTDAPGSRVSPESDSGHLRDINRDLTYSGIVYHPGQHAPQTDKVTLTVTDAFGASDSVNFIFNEAGKGPDVALSGTSGKDVIFASGYNDTLTGGAGADQFVFAPDFDPRSHGEHDTITDFTPGQDVIDLRAFAGVVDSSNLTQWLASHATTSSANSADTLITLGPNDTITLRNVSLAHLHASDFIVSSHHIT
jgi:VCBS repeat-containing protein